MEVSRRQIPAATCSRDVDVTAMWELRKRLDGAGSRQGSTSRSPPFALVMRATVLALRRFPTLNARIVDRDAMTPARSACSSTINLGFAADTDRGVDGAQHQGRPRPISLQLAVALAEIAVQGAGRDDHARRS
jgi:pyruvate/2-oxoglutarate dehydrogenase complex dihydrolipoamide acyltransferase (E2) component